MPSLVIDCLGDSLTAGVVSPTYPRILKQRLIDLGYADVQVHNRGKNGYTVGDYLEFQKSRTNSTLMQNRRIDFAAILLGGNDTRSTKQTPIDEFERDYRELIRVVQTQTRTKPQILLGNVPWYNGPLEIFWEGQTHTFDAMGRIVEEFNPCIERLAREYNFPYIDIYTPLKEAGPEILPDKIHPNAQGNEIIARTVLNKLEPLITNIDM